MTDTDTPDIDWLAQRFEAHRPRLRAVAYRMLGSVSEADDAVQDAWLRLSRADTTDVENLGGWLTTVVARLCLDMLRSRSARREQPADDYMPDPIVSSADNINPEEEAILADSVGLAMLIVLETLSPAERLAFVLHDMFGMPFEQVGALVGRSPLAARQLASRARRRVRGASASSNVSLARQREVVQAFLAAARAGDFEALLRILDPDAAVRGDAGTGLPGTPRDVRGAQAVAQRAMSFRGVAAGARFALVNGAAGFVVFAGDRPFAILGFTLRGDRITEIDILANPARLARIDLSALDAAT